MVSNKIIISTFLFLLNFAYLNAKPQNDARIVGGSYQPIIQRRFQTLITVGYTPICGGSIVSEDWVLTACHCTYRFNAPDLIVYVGAQSITVRNYANAVIEIVEHEEFNNKTLVNDIALLRIRDPIKLDIKLTTGFIELQETMPGEGTPVIVSGYGAREYNGTTTDDLMSAELYVIPNKRCVRKHKYVTEKMFCASVPENTIDSCQGDSGGPVTYDGKLLGIVSYGRGCARKGYPGVYTSVPEFIGWIQENMAKEYVNPYGPYG